MLNAFARDVKAALAFLNTPMLCGRSSVNEWGHFFSTSVSRFKNVIIGAGSHAQPDLLNTLLLALLKLLNPNIQPGLLKLIPASSHDKAEALELVLEDELPFLIKEVVARLIPILPIPYLERYRFKSGGSRGGGIGTLGRREAVESPVHQ